MGSIVLLGAEKGGVGKSMLACNLAAWAACRGASVVLLDADPQATSASWATRRTDNLLARDPTPAAVACVQRTGRGVRDTALDQARHHDLVVIDAGGRDSVELRFALTAASLVIVPFLPAQADLETLPKVIALIEASRAVNPGLQARALKSNVPTVAARYGEVLEADEALVALADALPLMPVAVTARKAFRDAFTAGLGAVEFGRGPAADEITALGAEIEQVLDIEFGKEIA